MDSMSKIVLGNAKHSGQFRCINSLKRRFDFVTPFQIEKALNKRLEIRNMKIMPIRDGFGSVVYHVKVPGSFNLILKAGIYADTHSPLEDYLYYEVNRWFESKLPLPQPLLLDLSGEYIPYPYLVMYELPGKSLLSQYEEGTGPSPYSALYQVACVLTQLHRKQINGYGFGPLTASTREIILQGKQPEVLYGVFEDAGRYYKQGLQLNFSSKFVRAHFSNEELLYLVSLIEEDPPEERVYGCPHGDPSLRNFLFKDGILTGVIDGQGRLGWIEEDIAAACVFIWQHSHRIPVVSPEGLLSSFFHYYSLQSERQLPPKVLEMFILRKSLSRLHTGLKLNDTIGIEMVAKLIKSIIAAKGKGYSWLSETLESNDSCYLIRGKP